MSVWKHTIIASPVEVAIAVLNRLVHDVRRAVIGYLLRWVVNTVG